MNQRAAAFFDVDGTIARGNVVAYYAFIRTHSMRAFQRGLWIAGFLPRIPLYYFLDKISRRWFATLFYRNYRAIPPRELNARARAHFDKVWESAIYPAAIQRIQKHQEQGHAIVLVSGSLEEIIEPLAEKIGDCRLVACRLLLSSDGFSGELDGGPLTGVRKAQAIRKYAQEEGIDLSKSAAYADSADDIPMLETVGQPHAVNPGKRLRLVALRRRWPILSWKLEN